MVEITTLVPGYGSPRGGLRDFDCLRFESQNLIVVADEYTECK